jgi:hypothetical protein
MKKVILLLLFIPCISFGQIADDFENGVISGWTEGMQGHWKADIDGSINGNFSLHHIFDNPSGGSDCIGLPLTNLHPTEGTTRWTFIIKHGYDPSASNNWAVFLMSDHDPSSFANGSDVSGYAAGVNLSGYDDTLRLWKIKKGQVSVVAACPVHWQNDIGAAGSSKIVVERSVSGYWNITIFDNYNQNRGAGSGSDSELFNPAWLVLNYRYTATRDRLLWLDDLKIEGVFYEDKTAPEITGARVTGRNSVELDFNEDPSDGILNPSVFLLNNSGNIPLSVQRKASAVIEIRFEERFINKTKNQLIINYLCDRSGNCTTNTKIEFTPAWAEPADVIISEIMVDPLPSVALPEKEYLEIINRTNFPFNLTNWSLASESQKTIITSAEIGPGEIIILCSSSDTSLFSKYGKTTALKSFPALTDEGRMIWLSDSSGDFIHGIEYSSAWYADKLKEKGGWSLEMIDTSSPFYTEGNWEASSCRKGGTPGTTNSASRSNPDLLFYGIENVYPEDSITINLSFSETVLNLAGSNGKILVDGIPVRSAVSAEPLMRSFIVLPQDPLKNGRVYTLFLTGDMKDFSGNEISRRSFKFGIPEPASNGEIVFNELLFNPFPDDPDYIELYNLSDKIIDASRLFLASINPETGDTSEVKPVSDERRCILPGSFYVVTADRNKVIERYPVSGPEYIFDGVELPSMPDDGGHLLLLNREMELIDEVIYSNDMHYSLLADDEGVSLEKIRPDILSAESMNWHSASESTGWGTPGTENSVFSPAPQSGDRINFSSGRISPDNDGYEDVLMIDLDSEGAGNVVTITIFDERGGFVRRIMENFLAGEKASVVWDATADDGSLVDSGIYIILIELYNDKGKTKSWKKVCAVLR